MKQFIEQIAYTTGITVEDADSIFKTISGQLVNKIPALQQVIEDVFENAEAEKLKEHINRMIFLLQQQQFKESFEGWKMPQQVGRIHLPGSDTIF